MNADTISVGTAKLIGSAPDIINRGPLRGIPQQSEPVVEQSYDSAVLTGKATIDVSSLTSSPPYKTSSWTPYQSLLRLNRQIRVELGSHSDLPAHRRTNLFVNYPHGLHVLQTTAPELLQLSRSVHVCGSYISPAHSQYSPQLEKPEELQGDVVPDAASQLSKLVKDLFGSNTTSPIEKLELRIYYPGHHSSIWSNDDSPTATVLRNIAFGKVEMVIWRGMHGSGTWNRMRYLHLTHDSDGFSGVHLTAIPVTERTRIISTRWRTLQEGGSGQPEVDSFVLDTQ